MGWYSVFNIGIQIFIVFKGIARVWFCNTLTKLCCCNINYTLYLYIYTPFCFNFIYFVGLWYNRRIVPQDTTENCPGTIPSGECAVQISTSVRVSSFGRRTCFVLMMMFSEQWVFLPDSEQRSQLVLPPPAHVDYRAACFCHRNLIEIGYVCSVCLSSKFWFPVEMRGSRFHISGISCSYSVSMLMLPLVFFFSILQLQSHLYNLRVSVFFSVF